MIAHSGSIEEENYVLDFYQEPYLLYKALEDLTKDKQKVELDKEDKPRTDFVKPFKVAKYVYYDPYCADDHNKVIFEVDEEDGKKIKSAYVSNDHFDKITPEARRAI